MSQSIPEDTPQKQCNRCKQFLPLSAYTSDRTKKDGLRTICKVCSKIPMPGPVLPPAPEGLRRCSKCKQCKPPSAYSTDRSNKKDGLHYACKECVNISRDTRKEHYATYRKARRERNKGRILEHERQYREEHRERMKARDKLYRQRPYAKAMMSARYHERRSRKLGNGGTYTAEDIQRLYKAQRGRCYYCKAKFHNGNYAYHIEHIVPLSRGGPNDASNIVLACPMCNWRKGNKLPHEWLEGGRLL